jgi:hypothetical protein
MKLKIATEKVKIPLESVVIFYEDQNSDEVKAIFYRGKKVPVDWKSSGNTVFHGSSVKFTKFRGNNLFFTPSLYGAYWFSDFANVGDWSSIPTYFIYRCKINMSKIYETFPDKDGDEEGIKNQTITAVKNSCLRILVIQLLNLLIVKMQEL